MIWAFGGCGWFPPRASPPIVRIGRVPEVIRIMCGGVFMACQGNVFCAALTKAARGSLKEAEPKGDRAS